MTKKILVPGAGIGQAIVLKRAKEMGLTSVVVSPKGDYPGFKYADIIYHEDVRNEKKVLEKELNILRRELGKLRGRSKKKLKREEHKTYVVQQGDTLPDIAKKLYGEESRWVDIYKANKDRNRKNIPIVSG